MNYKAELVAAGKLMLEKKLTVETWGNISLYDEETGLVYMTPSAMAYNTIGEEDVVVVRLSDGEIVEGHRKPTVEKDLHLGIYRARPDIRAVIHTHPVYSQVFAVLHKSIPVVIDEIVSVKQIRRNIKMDQIGFLPIVHLYLIQPVIQEAASELYFVQIFVPSVAVVHSLGNRRPFRQADKLVQLLQRTPSPQD